MRSAEVGSGGKVTLLEPRPGSSIGSLAWFLGTQLPTSSQAGCVSCHNEDIVCPNRTQSRSRTFGESLEMCSASSLKKSTMLEI